MNYGKIKELASDHIKEITGAKEISISKDFSERFSFKDVKCMELIPADWDSPALWNKRLEYDKTYSPFYRIHYMGIAYNENSCDFFDYKAYAIDNENLTFMKEEYQKVLGDMDSHFLDKLTNFGYVDSPKKILTLQVFIKDNSFFAISYDGNKIIKRDFEGKIGLVRFENKERILYTLKGNSIYRYKINTGEIDNHREYVGCFELENKELYYKDDKEIESIEHVIPYDIDFEITDGKAQRQMQVIMITFTDGTKKVLVDAPNYNKTVSNYYKSLRIHDHLIGLSKEEAKLPQNAKFKPVRFKYDEDSVVYYIGGLVLNYENEDSFGRIIIKPDCTQEVRPYNPITNNARHLEEDTEELTMQQEKQKPKQKTMRKEIKQETKQD